MGNPSAVVLEPADVVLFRRVLVDARARLLQLSDELYVLRKTHGVRAMATQMMLDERMSAVDHLSRLLAADP